MPIRALRRGLDPIAAEDAVPHGKGPVETVEDACERLLAHVAAMGRRFGVPAWLELTVPDFRDLPARTADTLVISVILALAEESSDGMAPMADVFLRDLDLKRLLWSLGIEQTNALPRAGGSHIADVEGSFRDAEAAGSSPGGSRSASERAAPAASRSNWSKPGSERGSTLAGSGAKWGPTRPGPAGSPECRRLPSYRRSRPDRPLRR